MQPDSFAAIPIENPEAPGRDDILDLQDIRNSLQSLMWRSVGVWREAARLEAARDSIAQWDRYVLTRQLAGVHGWELQNMLLVAAAMIEAALVRTESRGVHLREDFPDTDDAHWRRRVGVVMDDGRPVARVH